MKFYVTFEKWDDDIIIRESTINNQEEQSYDFMVKWLYDMNDDGKTIKIRELDFNTSGYSKDVINKFKDGILDHINNIYVGDRSEINLHPLFKDDIEKFLDELDIHFTDPIIEHNY